MNVEVIKERLHLRIEQADENLLQVLDELAESLFRAYQSDAPERFETVDPTGHTDQQEPLSRQEMTREIEESVAEYERGDYITLEESSKDATSW